MNAELKAAFDEMRSTEMALDDIDYLENSARLQKAITAAERFNALLDEQESRRRHQAPDPTTAPLP